VNILKAKNINRKYKVIKYKIFIKPVLMFGAETWVLSKFQKNVQPLSYRVKVFQKNFSVTPGPLKMKAA
jgi:hypothetical protein